MKKGQVSLLILAGLVILIATSVFVYMRAISVESTLEPETHRLTIDPALRSAQKAYVESALHSIAIPKNINTILNPSAPGVVGAANYIIPGLRAPICDGQATYPLSYYEEILQEAFFEELYPEIQAMNQRFVDYTFSLESLTVAIAPSTISITTIINVEHQGEAQDTQSLVEIPVRFGTMYALHDHICGLTMDRGIDITYLADLSAEYGLRIELSRYQDTLLVTLIDKESDYSFTFGVLQ